MSRISDMKKNRAAKFKSMQKKLEESAGGAPQDDRIWRIPFDKDKGKGSAIIRLLPCRIETCDDYVEQMKYNFKGAGGWFNELALQMIGEEDPVQQCAISMFVKAKHEGDSQLKEKAKKFLPKSTFYTNILVLKDEATPENEGKVFLFRFGYQIFNILKKKIEPEFDDEAVMDPFDIFGGANLKVRAVAKTIPDGQTGKPVVVPSYEDTAFDVVSELYDGDENKMEEAIAKTYDLSEFIDPEKVKAFDAQAKRFKDVNKFAWDYLSDEGVAEHAESLDEKINDNESEDSPPAHTEERQAGEVKADAPPDDADGGAPLDMGDSDDDDDVLKQFQQNLKSS